MTTPVRPTSSRLVSIDCLRGGAALAVVFYHTTGRDDSVFGPHLVLRSLSELTLPELLQRLQPSN